MRFLPRMGSTGYHLLLGTVALLILGPLGGVTAAYMNFAVGTFVGGQVLAGILGSIVTLGYGPEGKHGANYMQTMAASVASMAAMGVLIQAMIWLGMPEPAAWKLVLYFLCIGMFGVGVGMLYTPILVDRLKLTYPSGLAVANILRALTDPKILRRSVGTLGGGIGGGIGLSVLVDKVELAAKTGFSSALFGGGMIVGARIGVPVLVVGGIGVLLRPWLIAEKYIGEHDPFRKIGFIFALGTILGAAVVDLTLIARDAFARIRAARKEGKADDAKGTKVGRLLLWVAFWAAALMAVATNILQVPWPWVALAIALAFVFQMVNGISQGITDQNPISSAFVVTVLLMGVLGLRDPLVGLFGGSILLVSCTVGVDMQQDRSTGWRLGSDRAVQFRYQVLGILSGAVVAVLMTRVFLASYPVLRENLFAHPELRDGPARGWQSAMTYKFVGVLNTLSEDKTRTLMVMFLGIVLGLTIEVLRKAILKSKRYDAWKRRSNANGIIDFILDAVIIASPYASSFGGFVDFEASLWWAAGGVFSSVFNFAQLRRANQARQLRRSSDDQQPGEGEVLPDDMSTTSLVGGGMIAGESLFALVTGLIGLVASGALGKIFSG